MSLLLLISPHLYANSEEDYQQRLRALAKNIEALKAELDSAKNNKSNLQQSLQSSEKDISTLSRKVKSIEEAIEREKKRLTQLQSSRAELEQKQQQQQRYIRQILQQAYQLGQQSYVKLLLNQQQPERTGRLMRYHDFIIQSQQEHIDRYQHVIAELNDIETTIVLSQQQLQQQRLSLQQRQQQLTNLRKQRLVTLAKLNKELKQKGLQLDKYNEDRNNLQSLLDEVTSALANLALPNDAAPFSTVKGQLPMPTLGKIIHRYGSPQFDGKLKRHGIVIRNKAGAEVVSVHYGRVIFSDYFRGHGLLMIIDHGDGYMSLYGHNQALLKQTGDWVNSGEVIATVGNSGGQQDTALYFEIRHQGQPQNPQPWIKKS